MDATVQRFNDSKDDDTLEQIVAELAARNAQGTLVFAHRRDDDAAGRRRTPCVGELARWLHLQPEAEEAQLAAAIWRRAEDHLRNAIHGVKDADPDGVDVALERWRTSERDTADLFVMAERVFYRAFVDAVEAHLKSWVANAREKRRARKAHWEAGAQWLRDREARETAARERAARLDVVDFHVGVVESRNMREAERAWSDALCARREKNAPLDDEDDAVHGLARAVRGDRAPTVEELIAGIEVAFPAWNRDRRIAELSREIRAVQAKVQRARGSSNKTLQKALIAQREAARAERDALERERDGRPPRPPTAPRADLSAMSPEEKKQHKREQDRKRKQRQRDRERADGSDVTSVVHERLGGRCVSCGTRDDLHLHHLHDVECEVCFPPEDVARGLDTASKQRENDSQYHYKIASALGDDVSKHFALPCEGCHRDLHDGLVTLPEIDDDDRPMDEEDAAERAAGW